MICLETSVSIGEVRSRLIPRRSERCLTRRHSITNVTRMAECGCGRMRMLLKTCLIKTDCFRARKISERVMKSWSGLFSGALNHRRRLRLRVRRRRLRLRRLLLFRRPPRSDSVCHVSPCSNITLFTPLEFLKTTNDGLRFSMVHPGYDAASRSPSNPMCSTGRPSRYLADILLARGSCPPPPPPPPPPEGAFFFGE